MPTLKHISTCSIIVAFGVAMLVLSFLSYPGAFYNLFDIGIFVMIAGSSLFVVEEKEETKAFTAYASSLRALKGKKS